ncbi:MAG: hypothetical protein PHV05_13605 [Candidatus Riflebacteria bacterium]|nr:hypothetical protein [Candidatus Riflebacteria bacterium]
MVKRLLFLLLFFAVTYTLGAAKPVYVDTRLLVLAHPLWDSFDCRTGRFKGTASEFVEGGQKGLDKLFAEIADLNQWLAQSPKILKERLQQVALPDRLSVERTFFAEKREVEQRVAMLQMRAYMARMVPGQIGVTPAASIYPQINQIAADIRTVLKQIKEKHSAAVIIDSAELLPIMCRVPGNSDLLAQNLHEKLWSGEKADEKTTRWLDEASRFWADRLGFAADIIPFGAEDTRLESIKMLEDITKGLQK